MAKDYSKVAGVRVVGEGSAVGKVATPIFNAANDLAEGAGNLWQSVVDGAADRLASGKEAIVDTVDDVFDFDAEQEEEPTPAAAPTSETEESGGSILGSIGNAVSTATSTPAKVLLQDIFIPDAAKGLFTINENSFKEDEIEALREIVRKKGVGKITKADYGNVTIGDVRGGNEKNVATGGLTLADRLYNTLSEANVVKDEETGEYFIEDQYDWNVYVDYTEGEIDPKTGRQKGKVYKTEEFEESLSTGKEFWKTVTSGASLFEKAHNIAFLLGSRDYEGTDNEKDVGRKVRINLGKL